MNIDIKEINEMFLAESNLTDRQKEFVRQVNAIKEVFTAFVKTEIDGIVEKYARIEAERIVELYNKYIKCDNEKTEAK